MTHELTFLFRYSAHGPHAHVRVFVNGALAGNLTFRIEEWDAFRRHQAELVFRSESDVRELGSP